MDIYEVGQHIKLEKSTKIVLIIFSVPCGPHIYLARYSGM